MQKSTGRNQNEENHLLYFVRNHCLCTNSTCGCRNCACNSASCGHRSSQGGCVRGSDESSEEQCVERVCFCGHSCGDCRRGHRGSLSKSRFFVALTFLLAACSGPTAWHVDSISTGDQHFDSGKLVYRSPSSHLKLEFLRTATGISGFLSLHQHRFPTTPETEVSLTI